MPTKIFKHKDADSYRRGTTTMLLTKNTEILIKLSLMYKPGASLLTSRKTGESKTSKIGGS